MSPAELIARAHRAGVTLIWDSLGTRLRYDPRRPPSPELRAELSRRRTELMTYLEAERVRRAPPAASRGRARCAHCGEPCGTAMRCLTCAGPRVAPPPGLSRCPRCSRATQHATEVCLACMAIESGAVRAERMELSAKYHRSVADAKGPHESPLQAVATPPPAEGRSRRLHQDLHAVRRALRRTR